VDVGFPIEEIVNLDPPLDADRAHDVIQPIQVEAQFDANNECTW
jgi:hypothetical protein